MIAVAYLSWSKKMRAGIILSLIAAFILIFSCGDDSTGPSGPDITPSTLSVEFTGDSSKVGVDDTPGTSSHTALSITASGENETDSKGSCEVTASWTICDEAAFNSIIYRSESPGISSDPSSATILRVISDVTPDFTYYYALMTKNNKDLFGWSNEITVYVDSSGGTLPDVTGLQIDQASI